MKRMLTVLAGLCMAFNVQAQTWEEWFQQKETGIRYLLEQIVALRMYGSAVRKGYDLVNGGLKGIGHLKKGDLELHQEYFASMRFVKPAVKNSESIRRIISLQTAILNVYREGKGKVSGDEVFSKEEKAYFKTVLDHVATRCRTSAVEAFQLISDGHFQMRDDERQNRLWTIKGHLDDLYVFAKQFRSEIALAALNRSKERKQVKKLKSLY